MLKVYKTISNAHVTSTVAHQEFKVHGTVANLPGCGRKRKTDDKSKRQNVQIITKKPEQLPKRVEMNSKVKVHQFQIAPSIAESKWT